MLLRRALLVLELVAVFIFLPVLLSVFYSRAAMLGGLWGGTLIMMAVMLRDKEFHMRDEWRWAAVNRANLRAMLLRFAPFALVLTVFAYWDQPDRFLSLPLERPGLWVAVLTLYPILSVIPQELMWRSYFFRRYYALFPTPWVMIVASAVLFGFVHILLRNWVAVLACAAGGILFAHTHHKHRSLALTSLEHALYGCYVFTIGLGWYFYSGARMLH